MTPRIIMGWMKLRERRELGEQLMTLQLLRSAQADDKDVRKMIRKMEDESQ
jgi:hypothetical protein